MRKRGELARARKPLDEALVKAMANALRNQILAILGERKGSAVELSEELGIDYWQVNYEMDVLRKARLIKKVGERRRRGATEVFYEATARAYLDPAEWPKVADPVKAGLRASLFQNLLVDAATAICDETYDSLEGARMSWSPVRMSWSPVIVDEQGWKDLTAVLLRAMEEVLKIHGESTERLVADDQEGVSCTVSILGYPSAMKKRRVGLPVDAEEFVDLAISAEPAGDESSWNRRARATSAAGEKSDRKKDDRGDGPLRGKRAKRDTD